MSSADERRRRRHRYRPELRSLEDERIGVKYPLAKICSCGIYDPDYDFYDYHYNCDVHSRSFSPQPTTTFEYGFMFYDRDYSTMEGRTVGVVKRSALYEGVVPLGEVEPGTGIFVITDVTPNAYEYIISNVSAYNNAYTALNEEADELRNRIQESGWIDG